MWKLNVIIGVSLLGLLVYNQYTSPIAKEGRKLANEKSQKVECEAKLKQVKQDCASAGNILDCIAIRGEPYGIKYDHMNSKFFGDPHIKYFYCS
jgi:hypothetical protein